MAQPHHTDAAPASSSSLGFSLSTNGLTFLLFLLAHGRHEEIALQASVQLRDALTPRVHALVSAWHAQEQILCFDMVQRTQHVVEYLLSAIACCPSRSPADFSAWVAKRTLAMLDGEDLPTPPTPRASTTEDDDLRPAPRVEREAVARVALARLTPEDRYVLELRQRSHTTWRTVARTLRVSERTAQRLYDAAHARVQREVLDVLDELAQSQASFTESQSGLNAA